MQVANCVCKRASVMINKSLQPAHRLPAVARRSITSRPTLVMSASLKQVISTDKAPAALGPYSQAIKAGNTLYVSGQIGIIPGTKDFAADNVEGQTEQVMKNMGAILEAAGAGYANVVKTTILLADMGDFAKVNAIYGNYFTEQPPARATFAVKELPLGAKSAVKSISDKQPFLNKSHCAVYVLRIMQRAICIISRQFGLHEHEFFRTATASGQLAAVPTQLKDLQLHPLSSYATMAAGPVNNPVTLKGQAKTIKDIQLDLQQAQDLKSVNDTLLAFETLPATLVEAALSRVAKFERSTDQHPRISTRLASMLQSDLGLLLHTYTGQQLVSCLVSIAAGIPRDQQQPKLVSRIMTVLLDHDGEALRASDRAATAQVARALHRSRHDTLHHWEQLCKHVLATKNDWSKDAVLLGNVRDAFSWASNHFSSSTTMKETANQLAT